MDMPEHLKKLNQLDRIEYLLKNNKLEDEKPRHGIRDFTYLIIGLAFYVILLGVVTMGSIGKETGIKILNTIPQIFILGTVGVIILFILYLVEIISYLKKRKKLNEEFFNFKIEKKKKK